jgi:hypothetical protein
MNDLTASRQYDKDLAHLVQAHGARPDLCRRPRAARGHPSCHALPAVTAREQA